MMWWVAGQTIIFVLACVGVLFILALCGVLGGDTPLDRNTRKPEAPPAPPQPQIVNLRTVTPTEPAGQPQIFSKTTMQITTTKYIDPGAKDRKELSA